MNFRTGLSFSLVCLVGWAIAGCGSSASAPTPVPAKSYTDPHYHFSFSYPGTWHVPTSGQRRTISGTPSYVVDITNPGRQEGMELTIDHNLAEYLMIPEGKIATDPNGGPDTFHYHHLHVSGWPAIQVERYNASNVDEIDTIVNVGPLSYDLRTITAQPPFSPQVVNGYHMIVKTMKLPFKA